LNYETPEVHAEMKEVLKFWVEKGVDGFRCDVAGEIPDAYWQAAWAELRAINPDLYFLAEGEGPNFHADGFDACYAWPLKDVMNDIAQGKREPVALKEWVTDFTTRYPREAIQLMFTSNHDENSWAGTEFERLGDAAKLFATLTYVLPQGQPLIYTGQEIGYDHRFEFFEKDPVEKWEANEYTDFYRTLNALRHNNPALWAGEKGGELVYVGGVPEEVFAFTREVEGNKVLCLFNLSAEEQQLNLPTEVAGAYTDMYGAPATVETAVVLPAWGYAVYVK
ncbi:MAG: alpha-glucosidase C-terminal domain-containing protein, partial [Alistipes sp.]|nr:alpha-glucosidase C-terminal domain-containing protein [Alistipes sp.]